MTIQQYLVLTGLVATTAAQAAPFVVVPTDAVATYISSGTTGNYHSPLNPNPGLLTNTGMSAPLVTGNAVPANSLAVTADPLQWSNAYQGWLSQDTPVANSRVTFNLGQTYNVTSMLLWNYNEGNWTNNRGVKNVSLSYSTDGTSYTSIATFGFIRSIFTDTSTNWSRDPMQTATFASAVNAQYIRLDVLTTWIGADGTNLTDTNRAGISQVNFTADTVPEPASIALLAFGAVALLRRRRA